MHAVIHKCSSKSMDGFLENRSRITRGYDLAIASKPVLLHVYLHAVLSCLDRAYRSCPAQDLFKDRNRLN